MNSAYHMQALAFAEKVRFQNCLVAMTWRPKSTIKDLPSIHDMVTYIQNKCVKWLKDLEERVLISNSQFLHFNLPCHSPYGRLHLVMSPAPLIAGQLTTLKGHSWALLPTRLRSMERSGR